MRIRGLRAEAGERSSYRLAAGPSAVLPGDRLELVEHAVDLVGRVVVAEPDADGAARLLEAEALHDLERVVVAVPDVDPSLRECPRGLGGMLVAHPDRERGGALAHPAGLGDPEQADPGDAREPVEEPSRELRLPRDDRACERVGERLAPGAPVAEAREVPDRGDPAREPLVVLRPGL